MTTPNDQSETPRTDLAKFSMPMSWIATSERTQFVVFAETAERMEKELADLRTQLAAAQRERNAENAWHERFKRQNQELFEEVEHLTKERDDAMRISASVLETSAADRDALASQVAELQRDRERLNALDLLCKGYGCSGEHEGNRWVIDGPFADIRVAADDLIKRAAMRAKGEA